MAARTFCTEAYVLDPLAVGLDLLDGDRHLKGSNTYRTKLLYDDNVLTPTKATLRTYCANIIMSRSCLPEYASNNEKYNMLVNDRVMAWNFVFCLNWWLCIQPRSKGDANATVLPGVPCSSTCRCIYDGWSALSYASPHPTAKQIAMSETSKVGFGGNLFCWRTTEMTILYNREIS